MKKVLLIGDSIRLLYQPRVKELLTGRFTVNGSEDNGRFIKYSLNELGRWVEQFGTPDIVHWNNGLWDSAIVCEEEGAFTPVEEYVHYLEIMLRELKKLTPKVIFATTTPVRENSKNQKLVYIQERNLAAINLMNKNKVMINDLYQEFYAHVDDYIGEDKIHINERGIACSARKVADAICKIDTQTI